MHLLIYLIHAIVSQQKWKSNYNLSKSCQTHMVHYLKIETVPCKSICIMAFMHLHSISCLRSTNSRVSQIYNRFTFILKFKCHVIPLYWYIIYAYLCNDTTTRWKLRINACSLIILIVVLFNSFPHAIILFEYRLLENVYWPTLLPIQLFLTTKTANVLRHYIRKNDDDFVFEIKSKIYSPNCLSCSIYGLIMAHDRPILAGAVWVHAWLVITMKGNTISNLKQWWLLFRKADSWRPGYIMSAFPVHNNTQKHTGSFNWNDQNSTFSAKFLHRELS